MEKETCEKHIEQLDEKIQQADLEKEKVGEQHKECAFSCINQRWFKCKLSNIYKVWASFVQLFFCLQLL